MTDSLIIKTVGNIGRITLNRPKALNALNQDMVTGMIKALEAWRADDCIKVIIVDGSGDKGFCAGGDIRMLADSGKAADGRAWTFWRDEYQLNTIIKEYPKPYLALIDGITMGGGVGVSIHGSYRIVGDKTVFAMPETGIGFHPDVGGHYFLPRLDGEIGTWMGLTGARLKAADCIAAGVATHYVSSDKYDALLGKLENTALDDDAEKLESIVCEFSSDPGASDLALNKGLIDAAFEGDDIAMIQSRLDKAADAWSTKQARILASKSPTSCAVTLAAIRKGAGLNFREVMAQDLRLSMRFLDEGSDFYEGVRAVIIDKDNAPEWAIYDGEIDKYFESLDSSLEMSFFDPETQNPGTIK